MPDKGKIYIGVLRGVLYPGNVRIQAHADGTMHSQTHIHREGGQLMKPTFEELINREIRNANRKLDAIERETARGGVLSRDEYGIQQKIVGWRNALMWAREVRKNERLC